MRKFMELSKNSVRETEQEILNYWKEIDILNKCIENRKNNKEWVFYDGPIYANAKPGIHHVFAKTIKDSFCKYQTMKGNKVLRKIGLDTHGLPIEVNVEKKLGFKGKEDIEKFGIENFCRECNKTTITNIDEVNDITDMMGQFIDCKNPYVTCSNEYIESEWWLIKQIADKGLLYNGNKVLWYCPRCGTELSSHEISQGYKEVPVNTVYVPFKKSDEDVYFLVWTTTPWTLMSNVCLCVNPNFTYVKVESQGYKFILCEELVNNVLGDEYTLLEKYKGSDLVGFKYDQLMPFVSVEGKCFEVIADDYVTNSDGTGIVHCAPAYGEDDNRVCVKNGIGFVNPVSLEGKYTEGPWKGRLVTDSDLEIEIVKWLKDNDKLFKKVKINHDYPHCWRCKSALINYPKAAWYIRNTEYKDKIIEANNKINWYPSYVGEKRFGNWLQNMIDWGISRNRYWGCPLPVWTCECGNRCVIGSVSELQEKIIEDIDVSKMELHRPYVDELHIKCDKCGKTMSRVSDVMDVWFDSGAMPYAQYHYPFENKELFESQFPADFIAEGLDQTRGWFYVLLVISVLISGESSFKNVVVNDMMLDEFGKKMSKSTGNVIDPIEFMTKYGADNIRWYMMYVSPVWTPLKFSENGVKEVHSKFFNPLKNTYTFFQTYSNIDNIDIDNCYVDIEKREDIDKWLLSKYNKLVKNVTKYYDEYDLNLVTKEITSFVSEDLSNWYIRRNRDRFWAHDLDDNKKAVYITTYEVLCGLCKLCAPIIPYTTEELFRKLTDKVSVHLEDFPVCNNKLIDLELEEKMDLVRDLISLGRNVREEAKIKVRQPISEVILDSKYKDIIGDMDSLILEELNVKKINYSDDISVYMNISYKPNYKEVGKVFGADIKEFATYLSSISSSDIDKLNKNKLSIKLNGNKYDINNDMVETKISSKDGYNVSVLNNKFIILNVELSRELINEGLARETISKVQQLRKNRGFDITDRINIYYSADIEYTNNIDKFIDIIKSETLCVEMINDSKIKDYVEVDINDYKVNIKLEVVSK